jgi:hypothetical protein
MNTDVASIPSRAAADDERARIARTTVSAVLFREILKPLAAGLGPVGETALDRVADDLFVKRPA